MLTEILAAKIKPKEKERLIIGKLTAGALSLADITDFFGRTNDSGKGYCMAAITAMVKSDAAYASGILDFVMTALDSKAGRVKWEAAEIIGLSAAVAPDKCAEAIMPLLKNTEAEGTVARWSAAFALTAIAQHNSATRPQLLPLFEKIIAVEESNAIKKMYHKALKLK